MSMFVPSEESFGAEEAAPAASSSSSSSSYLDLAQSMIPAADLASQLVGKSDREKLAILRARVQNYESMKRAFPASAFVLDMQIRKYKAQIRALKAGAKEEKDASADYSLWRNLTSVAGVAGIVAVGSIAYFFIRRAGK